MLYLDVVCLYLRVPYPLLMSWGFPFTAKLSITTLNFRPITSSVLVHVTKLLAQW